MIQQESRRIKVGQTFHQMEPSPKDVRHGLNMSKLLVVVG